MRKHTAMDGGEAQPGEGTEEFAIDHSGPSQRSSAQITRTRRQGSLGLDRALRWPRNMPAEPAPTCQEMSQ